MELTRNIAKINIFALAVGIHFFLWVAVFKYFAFLS